MEKKEPEIIPRGSQQANEKEAERRETMEKTIHHTELTKTESKTYKQVCDKGEKRDEGKCQLSVLYSTKVACTDRNNVEKWIFKYYKYNI
jgi:hypothetical protein